MDCYLQETCKKYKNNSCPFPEFCIKKFKMDKFFDLALLPENKRDHITLVLDDNNCDYYSFCSLTKIKENIKEFVEKGKNLYIYSPITGNGKTAWTIKLLQAYVNSIWYNRELSCAALFIGVPRYLLSIKDAISNVNDYAKHIKENVLLADLVIWDDVATKTMTEFETENVLSIIDARINMGKSNIFTSNISPDELRLYVGDRLGSRIIGNSEQIKFVGSDKRSLGKVSIDDSVANS